MQIPYEWHPFEIIRRLKLFWAELQHDLDLRFPDTRRRIALELRFNIPTPDRPRFSNVINRFQNAKRSISFLDWGLLMEWNERRRQAEALSQIVHEFSLLPDSAPEGMEVLYTALKTRLQEILDSIRSEPLKHHPSLLTCIRYRWRYIALRDEAVYLRTRIREILQDEQRAA